MEERGRKEGVNLYEKAVCIAGVLAILYQLVLVSGGNGLMTALQVTHTSVYTMIYIIRVCPMYCISTCCRTGYGAMVPSLSSQQVHTHTQHIHTRALK